MHILNFFKGKGQSSRKLYGAFWKKGGEKFLQVYAWRARNKNGRVITGKLLAESPRAVAQQVQAKYGYVTEIKLATPAWFKQWFNLNKHLNLQDKEKLFRQLGSLLESGISIIRALDIIAARGNDTVAEISASIRGDLEQGLSFSKAICKLPAYFSSMVIQLVEAGEASGNLPYLLLKLADYYQQEREIRNFIINACLYPGMVMSLALFIGICFLFQILPIFLDLYSSLQVESGMLLRWIFSIIVWSQEYVVALVITFLLLMITFYGRRSILQKWFLQFPLIKGWYHTLWEARYCRVLSLLLASGITLTNALLLLGPFLPTSNWQHINSCMSRAVLRGIPLSRATTVYSGIFGDISTEFIGLGEENGSLALMLHEAAKLLESELRAELKKVKICLEPILLLILTFIIGGIVYFIMTPVYGLVAKLPSYS